MGNILFGHGVASRGFGPYTPHGVPKGSVCIHGTNYTFQFGARPGEAVLPTTLPVGVCVVQMVGMSAFRVIFMTFRS